MTETLTYDQAYEQYYGHLVRYVHQLTYDWSASEDIAQDTMLKAWLHWESIQCRIRQWLFRVAYNASIDHLRRRNCIEMTDIAIVDTEQDSDMTEVVALSALVDELPEKYKQVIQLRIQQYRDKDIADILNITPTDSKTRASRGRILMRKMAAA